jgi:hypothetical protein
MTEFFGPLYNWLQQFRNHYPTHCHFLPTRHFTETVLTSNWSEVNCQLSRSLMLRPTVSRPLCLGIKHPSRTQGQIFITVRELRVCWCGALSDGRTGLSVTIAAGLLQRSRSWVRVLWYSRPYFTFSDLSNCQLLLASRYIDSGRTTAQEIHPLSSNGYAKPHRNAGFIVACIAYKWIYSIVGCVIIAGLFTESLPSNGSTSHNAFIRDPLVIYEWWSCTNIY